jgi:hypothetical protein
MGQPKITKFLIRHKVDFSVFFILIISIPILAGIIKTVYI